MPIKAIDPTKPILGYTLKQRLGAGGYGEVWAAEAPGGLPKAVKFVYGYHEEKRAQGELKALNRIRSVRHPFLLSLERIDVVDGQLIVISELADMCLKTRFEECVDSGLNGIPRAELLGYMREASQALDFISDEFKLQHLDVKPENLLLVSGHIKVADFGLVKDIHDGTQSMMSGLTPAYAPPELFDGRPSKASDQYSLAILFQELLTGQRPFNGATAAQLASQHIKERPNLKPLPRDDQASIARALSKDPEQRFESCGALVDALSSERVQPATPRPRTRTKLREGKRRKRKSSNTISTMTLTAGTRQFAISPTETAKLPKLEYNPSTDAKCRPTLFVGVGRSGTQIVGQIRRRLYERHGEPDAIPSIKVLCVDTDTQDIASACGSGGSTSLLASETFPMPLRAPKEYREDASMHLAWLSRRWIYNVPKSLRTEGIRPLGRLAMATHIDELAIRLRQVLSDLVHPEHLATTAATLELEPNVIPRVVIVGAISGGTCSGMGIDLAYIVRAILRQLGVTNEDVLGVFTHSSTSRDQRRELSIANTLAFLNELYHFSCVEEYPGDTSCGIPPSTDRTTTFASTYLVELGTDLGEKQFDAQLDAIAEYLYLGSASACSTYLDNCRQAESESEGLPLRTFGLCQSNAGSRDLVLNAAEILGKQVAQDWTTELPQEGFETERIALDILEKNSATLEPIVGVVHETLDHVLQNSVEFVKNALIANFDPENRGQSKSRVREEIAGIFAFDLPAGMAPTKLSSAIDAICNHYQEQLVPKISNAILAIVDTPGPRIAGAAQVAFAIQRSLGGRKKQLEQHVETVTRQLEQRYDIMLSPDTLVDENGDAFFTAWAQELLQRFTLESTIKITNATLPAMSNVNQAVNELRSQFEYATSIVTRDETQDASEQLDSKIAEEFHQRVVATLEDRLPRLAQRVEQQLQHNMLEQHGGMRAVLSDVNLRHALRTHFEAATRASVVEELKEIPLQQIFDDTLKVDEFATWMAEEANPILTSCGGAMRAMHTYPRRTNAVPELIKELSEKLEQQPAVIPATIGEIVTCIEAERVPLDNVAMHLLQHRPDSIEYASRLHTRTDIAWTHISSMR